MNPEITLFQVEAALGKMWYLSVWNLRSLKTLWNDNLSRRYCGVLFCQKIYGFVEYDVTYDYPIWILNPVPRTVWFDFYLSRYQLLLNCSGTEHVWEFSWGQEGIDQEEVVSWQNEYERWCHSNQDANGPDICAFGLGF